EHDGHGDNDEIDAESDHPACQHALEQFRVRGRVVGVGFDVDRHTTEMEKKSLGRKGLQSGFNPLTPGWNAAPACGMVRGTPGDIAWPSQFTTSKPPAA